MRIPLQHSAKRTTPSSGLIGHGLMRLRSREAMLFGVALVLFSFMLLFPMRSQSLLAALERFSFDGQMRLLREYFPRPAPIEPVLIGIDDAALAQYPEPLALWHKHYAKVYEALARARPKVVGIDVVLPEKSFDYLQPGSDFALLKGLVALQAAAPVVYASTIDRDGKTLPIHTTFIRVIGEERDDRFGVDQFFIDPDQVARRFDEAAMGPNVRTLAGQMARALGYPVGAGYVDFSVGEPVNYVSMQRVIAWLQDENEAALKQAFAGKVVLLGSVTQSQDRWRLPVNIAAWETIGDQQLATQPGVVLHLQTLRSLLGHGLIRPLSGPLLAVLCLGLLALVWRPFSQRLAIWVFVAAPLLGLGISLFLLTQGVFVFGLTLLAALWTAAFVRMLSDSAQSTLEKNRLKQSFAGNVSPAVLEEMLSGNISVGVSADTRQVCVLFSDIRGFTALSELLSPEMVTTLLTRYFDRMVDCVHRHEGTIDKFMGDGMMVLFGAPRSLADPCGAAVQCACEMTQALKDLNAEFAAEGLPGVAIGIGINYGKVVVGNIGSTERHNYSAIGDAVNVASRLEGMTKELGVPIVLTEAVKMRLDNRFELEAFGEQAMRGHSPMPVWGVKVD